jgi:excisionase family DNA binding protein
MHCNSQTKSKSIPISYAQLDELPIRLRTDTAAGIANCAPRTMRNLCAAGKVKATKVGRDWRIDRDSLLRFCALV